LEILRREGVNTPKREEELIKKIEEREEVGKKYDFTVKSFGHAGDGNLHIYACSNDMEIGEFKAS